MAQIPCTSRPADALSYVLVYRLRMAEVTPVSRDGKGQSLGFHGKGGQKVPGCEDGNAQMLAAIRPTIKFCEDIRPAGCSMAVLGTGAFDG